MEVVKNTKGDRYAKKQSLRDDEGALGYLETAGDTLIRELAKKQTSKVTTLGEQLGIRQDFEKGAELKPWCQTGLSSLGHFKVAIKSEEASSSTAPEIDYSFESLKNRSGLTRHELELGIVEKPGSQSSRLYKFALANLKPKKDLVSELPGHPLNRLKEIEKEVFAKKRKDEKEDKSAKRKKKRKRRKKIQDKGQELQVQALAQLQERQEQAREGVEVEKDSEVRKEETKSYRPSLWDVKDMKKFLRKEKPGCHLPKMYTIKDGKITEVGTACESEGYAEN